MNLLYTITAYPPSTGGAQLHTHLLALQLSNRHAIQVISQWDRNRTDWLLGTTLKAPSQPFNYFIDQIDVYHIGLSLSEKINILPFVLIYYPFIKSAIKPIANNLEKHLFKFAKQSDVVHNVRIGRECLSYASYNIARKCDIPFVFTPLHHSRWLGWRYEAFISLYSMADLVISLTEVEKRTLVELGVSGDRIEVTGIGPVLAERAEPEKFLRDHVISGPMILFLGQHYPYKGYRQLLQATKLVWKKVPEAHFVFIGPAIGWSEREFRGAVDKRIHRLGKVDLQEKTNALAACTVLCVPSTQESFGGVYVEAWSFGKPVIGCAIPSVSEVISDGVDGYLVQQNPREIADYICHLLIDRSKAETMGVAGKRKVEERYSWEKIAERTELAYQKVI